MSRIEIRDLKKTYKSPRGETQALKGVSFAIEKGEFFGLLGPNGAGKSTMINILAGIAKKSSGDISVGGISIDQDHRAVKKMIGVVPQEVAFDVFFDIETALRFQFGFFGLPFDQVWMDELLETLSLSDKRTVKPRMLSGGMKRRFMIAKAMIHKPEVLVLDEPTAGVDIELRHDLYDLVRDLNKRGTTIILTSHYLEEVELLCERIAIINHGELIALDHKDALKSRFDTTRKLVLALTKSVKIPDALKSFAPKLDGTILTLTFEEDKYRDVLRTVGTVDLPVANFHVVEPSLEDVFLSLTTE